MQAHPGVIGFFEAPYFEDLAPICLGGQRRRRIRLARGVRRGGPIQHAALRIGSWSMHLLGQLTSSKNDPRLC
eukprot:7921479-Pyramimonas_sp.AAC.1